MDVEDYSQHMLTNSGNYGGGGVHYKVMAVLHVGLIKVTNQNKQMFVMCTQCLVLQDIGTNTSTEKDYSL